MAERKMWPEGNFTNDKGSTLQPECKSCKTEISLDKLSTRYRRNRRLMAPYMENQAHKVTKKRKSNNGTCLESDVFRWLLKNKTQFTVQ